MAPPHTFFCPVPYRHDKHRSPLFFYLLLTLKYRCDKNARKVENKKEKNCGRARNRGKGKKLPTALFTLQSASPAHWLLLLLWA